MGDFNYVIPKFSFVFWTARKMLWIYLIFKQTINVCSHQMSIKIVICHLHNNNNDEVSISPTFYARLFCTKVLHETFLYLDLRFVLFWRKSIGAKATSILLVKLTRGACLDTFKELEQNKIVTKFWRKKRIRSVHFTVAHTNDVAV